MSPVRKLGPLSVSAISLGCMNLSHAYGTPSSEDEAARLLNHALDAGVTMLDTAALYGGGRNEALLGRYVMHRRGEFVLASKCVLSMVDGERVLDGSPDAIVASVERSLLQLNTDHIDLMYVHRLDPRVPIEESVGALARLKAAGKIGSIGVSEVSAATIRRAHAVHPLAAVQSEYSPWVRNPEVAVLQTCRELGIGFVAFSPLGRGVFAGAVSSPQFESGDIRLAMPRFQEPNFTANLDVIRRFDALAANAGVTPAQLSLAWLLSRGDHVTPIPGTRSIAHLDENLQAARAAPSPDILEAVQSLLDNIPGRGARYNAATQAQIDTEIMAGEDLA